jgi:hypothetical protein
MPVILKKRLLLSYRLIWNFPLFKDYFNPRYLGSSLDTVEVIQFMRLILNVKRSVKHVMCN